MNNNIKVVVKVRPLISREIEEQLNYYWRVQNNTLIQTDQNGLDYGQNFTFDKVYDKDTNTTDVYNDIAKPIVEASTRGINGTIFAYGQTSSGKTYTMVGTDDSSGIMQLAVYDLFKIIKSVPDRDFLLRVSYIEIYNETLNDLLNLEKTNLKIQESFDGIKVEHVTEKVTTTPEEIFDLMRQGEANRQNGATIMNEKSSRSHSIFQIMIESREHGAATGSVNVSVLNLVDLAGSERPAQSGATGLRFREGTLINRSLSTLAHVIKQLSDNNKHANYRDSKLTRILQNSLGGNANTSIICAITPASIDETISTLQFANRAKTIKNKPQVNAVANDASMIQKLTEQLSRMQTKLESTKNLEQDNMLLKSKIEALQRQILNAFNHRSSAELTGAGRRRTWCAAPRRATFAALDPIHEDAPAFCTPAVKHNPMMLSRNSDFVPIVDECKETTMEKSPPLAHEVIELDSDDELPVSMATCSPTHKCHGLSKTPPCILRENAHIAQKNYEELIELTNREKLYTPSIEELMDRLDQNTSVIERLKDEVLTLTQQCKDKDDLVSHLNQQIQERSDSIQAATEAQEELRKKCQDCDAKLAEWEFSYETLKKKFKSREEELLSLLEERKVDVAAIIDSYKTDNQVLTNFMDMSKDMTLVNSDNEGSNDDDEDITRSYHDLITNLQTSNDNKQQTIQKLELQISSEREHIITLDNERLDFQNKCKILNEKLLNIEEENGFLKSEIATLNLNIENKKETIESMKTDIISYNNTIDELQLLLNEKEIISNTNIMANIFANEAKLINNNDNIKNLIHGLQNYIETRNKKIMELKATSDNYGEVNKMLESHLESLKMENVELKHTVTQNELNEQKMLNNNKGLETQISQLKELVEKLKKDIDKYRSRDHVDKIMFVSKKIFEIIISADFSAKTPDYENSDTNLTNLCDNVNSLEIAFHDILLQRTNNIESIAYFIREFDCMNEKFDKGILRESNDDVIKHPTTKHDIKARLDKLNNHLEMISKKNTDLENELSKASNHSITLKNDLKIKTEENMLLIEKELKINLELHQLEKLLLEKGKECDQLQAKLDIVSAEVEKLQKSEQRNIQQILMVKDKQIEELVKTKESLQNKLQEFVLKQEDYENIRLQLLKNNNENSDAKQCIMELKNEKNILKMDLTDLNQKLTIACVEIETLSKYNEHLNHEHKIILEHTSKEIEQLKNVNIELKHNIYTASEEQDTLRKENIDVKENTKQEIERLKRTNRQLQQDIGVDNSYSTASQLLKILQEENNDLNNLLDSNKLLDYLKSEITGKSTDIETLRNSATKIKFELGESQKLLCEQLQDTINTIESNSEKPQHDTHLIKSEPGIPLTLTNICYNKVIDIMFNKSDKKVKLTSNSCSIPKYKTCDIQVDLCKCNNNTNSLRILTNENLTLRNEIEELKTLNYNLNKDIEEVRQEIKLFTGPACELYKKINDHRTNLSTLTATNFAQTNLLKFKVKDIQHNHNRLHSVCHRYVSELKKQLLHLYQILEAEHNNGSTALNDNSKRYSLPILLNRNSSLISTTLRNESNMTLDSDLLMLDTNITFNTSTDNTIIAQDQTCLNITIPNVDIDIEPLECDSTFIHDKHQKEDDANKVDCENLAYLGDNFQQNKNTIFTELSESFSNCKQSNSLTHANYLLHCDDNEITKLQNHLSEIKKEKDELEKKYNHIILEIDSSNAQLLKLKCIEKDCSIKTKEIEILKSSLTDKSKLLLELQKENDNLSNEIMENISEVDNLKIEIDSLKTKNKELSDNNIKNINCEDKSKFSGYLDSKHEQKSCLEKNECFEYYIQHTGADREHLNKNMKILDIMKMLYDSLVNKHGSEIENLKNKLCHFEDSKVMLESKVVDITRKYDEVFSELQSKKEIITEFSRIIQILKANIDTLNDNVTKPDCDNVMLVSLFKQSVLDIFDKQFVLPISPIFNAIVDIMAIKHKNNFNDIMIKYDQLQEQTKSVVTELNKLKMQLKDKENEYNLLQATKDSIQQISGAVTLDIIRKEREFNEVVNESLQMLLANDIKAAKEIDLNISAKDKIKILTKQFIELYKDNSREILERQDLTVETDTVLLNVKSLKAFVKNKDQELLRKQHNSVHKINKSISWNIVDKEDDFTNEYPVQDQTIESIEGKFTNINTSQLSYEVSKLKETILKYVSNVNNLSDQINETKKNELCSKAKEDKYNEIVEKVALLKKENDHLNQINDIIRRESEGINTELVNVGNLLKGKEREITQMEATINNLNESLKEKVLSIQEMKSNIQTLLNDKDQLKNENKLLTNKMCTMQTEYEKIDSECKQLQVDVKTHLKSAEIQCNIIKRLQKQNDDKTLELSQKEQAVETLTASLATLQQQYDALVQTMEATRRDIDLLKKINSNIQSDVSSLDSDSVRRRRRSLHDANRTFVDDHTDDADVEEVFSSRTRPSDLFLPNDGHSELEHARGDSLPKLEQETSRSRRQSAHDQRRAELHVCATGDETSQYLRKSSRRGSSNSIGSDVCTLRSELELCRSELDQLRQRNRELDEECETCARYLQERDERCSSLHAEKVALEAKLLDMTQTLSRYTTNDSHKVNTDASQGSGKDKEKSLALKELEHRNEELKTIVAALQKKLDKTHNATNEVCKLRSELESCRSELDLLRQRNRELDEECETCARYLQERDERCSSLHAEKVALEKRLSEVSLAGGTKAHAAVNTDEDWSNLHSVVVDRMSFDAEVEKNKKLTAALEQFHQKNRHLKATLAKMQNKLETVVADKEVEVGELRERCRHAERQLREGEGHCGRLQVRLSELQASKKKRQSLYDQNRDKVATADATTNTDHGQANRSYLQPHNESKTTEIQALKTRVEQLAREKAALEQRLPHTVFVSTDSAIVQSQQITDIMKENHKLKNVNSKLVKLCQKRGKSFVEEDIENERPAHN